MNPNEDQMLAQLERELFSLQPLPPDPSLMLRLERTLHDPVLDRASTAPAAQKIVPFRKANAPVEAATGHNQVAWKPWAAVAACAAVATTAVTWKHNQLKELQANSRFVAGGSNSNNGPRSNYIPKNMESKVQGVSSGGLRLDPQRGLMREVRVEFNNQQEYVDPHTGSKLEIRYPSVEEIFVLEPVQ
jgi:hypothetical protein